MSYLKMPEQKMEIERIVELMELIKEEEEVMMEKLAEKLVELVALNIEKVVVTSFVVHEMYELIPHIMN